MSIGSMSGVGAIAGAPLAQRGAETDRVAHDTSQQTLRADSRAKAEAAAGIGETDGKEHSTSERDADGRRLWEQSAPRAQDPEATDDPASAIASKPSKDASGASGNSLDLTG